MPVTVIVGGQFGSEGKGKVAHFLAKEMGATVAIRVGGPNSGHTVIDESGRPIVFRQLPTAALLPNVHCVLPPGSYIRTAVLQEEIRIAGIDVERLSIDPNAVVITDREISEERDSSLRSLIGSTQSGTGAAVIARAGRIGVVKLARHEDALLPYVRPTTEFLRDRLEEGERVIIEGTQGFGLSSLHSPFYPYSTSRDTTASGFLAEAGLSPVDVDDIVMVIRAFPIRVAGTSGPLTNEIDWATITTEGKHNTPIIEFTTVTKFVRRVARFDHTIVQLALKCNRPTRLVLNHLDYLDGTFSEQSGLTDPMLRFLRNVEVALNRKCDLVGLGPDSLMGMTSHGNLGSTL